MTINKPDFATLDLPERGGFTFSGLSKVNVLLGKNGSGKSTSLKAIDLGFAGGEGDVAQVKYLSPERGGELKYDPGQDQNISSNPSWLAGVRRNNQALQFRQQSAVQFRNLEMLELRKIESDRALRSDFAHTFDITIEKINGLLDNVAVRRTPRGFSIHSKSTGEEVLPANISSGESELISLAIEILVFSNEAVPGKQNLLLMDEPDLHLHPDAQSRLARFLLSVVEDSDVRVIIATHSTPMVSAFREGGHTRIAFLTSGMKSLAFEPISDVHKKILPIFGAHPLSNVFNEAPVLLVEGEDDERVWQQAVRSSQGEIRLFPCDVGGNGELPTFEEEVRRITSAIYDHPTAYSLRDRDESVGELSDMPPLTRMRLGCRAAENLMLSDDVLASLGTDWGQVSSAIQDWLKDHPNHPHHVAMEAFHSAGPDRKGADLKVVRNDLLGLIGTNKPWEVAVGQAIARLVPTGKPSAHGLEDYLGAKTVSSLIPGGASASA